MNDKAFKHWQKARKAGFIRWVLTSTCFAGGLYVTFNALFAYPSYEDGTIFQFFIDNALNYSIYTFGMFFVFWWIWISNESKFHKETARREDGELTVDG